jgi:hypothetical protein
MFKTIDSGFCGPYSSRIEKEINDVIADIFKQDSEHAIVIATRFLPETGADFGYRWPRLWTLLQRNEIGDIRLVFMAREDDDKQRELGCWHLSSDEVQIAWLSFPFEE